MQNVTVLMPDYSLKAVSINKNSTIEGLLNILELKGYNVYYDGDIQISTIKIDPNRRYIISKRERRDETRILNIRIDGSKMYVKINAKASDTISSLKANISKTMKLSMIYIEDIYFNSRALDNENKTIFMIGIANDEFLGVKIHKASIIFDRKVEYQTFFSRTLGRRITDTYSQKYLCDQNRIIIFYYENGKIKIVSDDYNFGINLDRKYYVERLPNIEYVYSDQKIRIIKNYTKKRPFYEIKSTVSDMLGFNGVPFLIFNDTDEIKSFEDILIEPDSPIKICSQDTNSKYIYFLKSNNFDRLKLIFNSPPKLINLKSQIIKHDFPFVKESISFRIGDDLIKDDDLYLTYLTSNESEIEVILEGETYEFAYPDNRIKNITFPVDTKAGEAIVYFSNKLNINAHIKRGNYVANTEKNKKLKLKSFIKDLNEKFIINQGYTVILPNSEETICNCYIYDYLTKLKGRIRHEPLVIKYKDFFITSTSESKYKFSDLGLERNEKIIIHKIVFFKIRLEDSRTKNFYYKNFDLKFSDIKPDLEKKFNIDLNNFIIGVDDNEKIFSLNMQIINFKNKMKFITNHFEIQPNHDLLQEFKDMKEKLEKLKSQSEARELELKKEIKALNEQNKNIEVRFNKRIEILNDQKQATESRLEKKIKKLKAQNDKNEMEWKNQINDLKSQNKALESRYKGSKSFIDNNMITRSLYNKSKENINDFVKINEIGRGRFGEVFKVKSTKSNNILANKIYMNLMTQEKSDNFRKICESASKFNHPCVVSFRGFSMQSRSGFAAILFEYADKGTLQDILDSKPAAWTETRKSICILEIAFGMKYLHENKIIHRDLKPSNILCTGNYHFKISDFSESTFCDIETTQPTCYMYPEILESENAIDESIDVYSFGIILYYIFVGKLPDITIREFQTGKSVDIPTSIKQFVRELIDRCLQYNNKKRPTFKEIIDILKSSSFKISDGVDEVAVLDRYYELLLYES